MAAPNTTPTQLLTSLLAVDANLPQPSTAWLTALLSTQKVNIPLTGITATAKHRLLSSDLTTANLLATSNATLPPNLADPAVKERVITAVIVVQILEIEDMSKSRWEQLEAIEAEERGEMVKGREVIRTVPAEDEAGGGAVAGALRGKATGGPHKLVLQDWKGQKVFGIELKPITGLKVGMDIGTKLVLRGPVIARGMVLLEPRTVALLGGRVEVMHRAWLEGRKADLRAGIEQRG